LNSQRKKSCFYNFKIARICCFAYTKQIQMKKCIIGILSAWLIIGFMLLPGRVFSQSNQENKIKTDSATQGGNSTYVSGITAGRAKALVGTAAGLISFIIGWRTKVRSSRGATNKGTGAKVAFALGIIAIVLSVVHLSTSAGAVFGSGSGKAGAIFALLLGLIGMTLGGLALRQKKI
jgi:hypothetical protein